MNYIRTKLSFDDKDILKKIYDKLEEITLPTRFQKSGGQGHQIRTGSVNQKNARQTIFGHYKYNYNKKRRSSQFTKKYPYMMKLFKKFISSHYAEFKFDCVYVNKNVICKKHLDSKNIGESLLVGLGPYTLGKTILYINGKEKSFHIKNFSLIFNGSEIEHKSEPFKGNRYSLVFFKS